MIEVAAVAAGKIAGRFTSMSLIHAQSFTNTLASGELQRQRRALCPYYDVVASKGLQSTSTANVLPRLAIVLQYRNFGHNFASE